MKKKLLTLGLVGCLVGCPAPAPPEREVEVVYRMMQENDVKNYKCDPHYTTRGDNGRFSREITCSKIVLPRDQGILTFEGDGPEYGQKAIRHDPNPIIVGDETIFNVRPGEEIYVGGCIFGVADAPQVEYNDLYGNNSTISTAVLYKFKSN